MRRAAGVVAAAVLFAACGSGGARSAQAPAPAVDAAAGIPAGTVLNVGDQQQLLQTLLSVSGVSAGLPYKINYVQFASGPLVDAGFAAHRIDIGFMGDLPAALAVQSGLPVKVEAAEKGVGPDLFLIAKPGITSISQLAGKQVAYTTGTAEQAFALRALSAAHLKQADVRQVNVALQQLYTVLETGAVDASVITGVQEEKLYLQQHPTAKVLATNETVTPATYAYELVTTDALENPAKSAAIDDFVKRLLEASNWAYTHQSQYATDYLVDVEHETPAEAALGVTGGLIPNWVPITSDEEAALQNVVDLVAGTGAIKSSFSVAPLFDPVVSAAYNRIVNEVPQRASTGS